MLYSVMYQNNSNVIILIKVMKKTVMGFILICKLILQYFRVAYLHMQFISRH